MDVAVPRNICYIRPMCLWDIWSARECHSSFWKLQNMMRVCLSNHQHQDNTRGECHQQIIAASICTANEMTFTLSFKSYTFMFILFNLYFLELEWEWIC
ncbi:hypothetical protein I7I53_03990 [Histoplasma capsulatum var. duboisii H88]|uniref:Uncharacterized protein n=1 Tax=Ajellomyces capsulatus (strain H88) TaxID=544711 RepID=A0A8A1LPV7_AJEC8|nr:hypothetical protein I7I53_03990 [Histoplasma capsulatum var. duboisii H88]